MGSGRGPASRAKGQATIREATASTGAATTRTRTAETASEASFTESGEPRAAFLRNAWTPWARWFRAAGLDWPEPARGPVFDDSGLLLRAALQGDGVALGRHWLAIEEVRAGRLCAPFSVSLRDDFSYWLVWLAGRNLNPETAQFRDWLAARAAAEEHPCPLAAPEHVVAA